MRAHRLNKKGTAALAAWLPAELLFPTARVLLRHQTDARPQHSVHAACDRRRGDRM